LGVNQDAIFRRILGVAKDVILIERSLNEISAEFNSIEQGGFDLKKLSEYLPQLNQRVFGMKQDLEVFKRIISELSIDDPKMSDVKFHQSKTLNNINVRAFVLLF
jgi:hypothetical protein